MTQIEMDRAIEGLLCVTGVLVGVVVLACILFGIGPFGLVPW